MAEEITHLWVSRLEKNLDRSRGQLPVVYHKQYNITMWGLEKLHPFDSCKWGRIIELLKEKKILADESFCVKPETASADDLLKVHTNSYLKSLSRSFVVARITEVPIAACVPNYLIQRKLLNAMRLQTGGTVLACILAKKYGWAINIGGGFHHSSAGEGGGFCVYADIQLGLKALFDSDNLVHKVLIVDLDAHQGNGHEKDFEAESRVAILDAFNPSIYPLDYPARNAIHYPIHISSKTTDEKYVDMVRCALSHALDEENPDFVLYNAGTDIMAGDPLGGLNISPDAVVERDKVVFSIVRTLGIPICMVTSGGYQPSTAGVVANSIQNLWNLGLLQIFDKPERDSKIEADSREAESKSHEHAV